jgi:ribosomal protein L29
MPRVLPILLVVAATLQGCASPPQEPCRSVDWYGIGYQDGLQGHPPRSVVAEGEACSSSEAMSPLASYTRGRSEGLKRFCQPDNGFELGLTGGPYNGVCGREAEQAFLSAYERGKAIVESELQIRRLGEILQVNVSELEKLSTSLRQKVLELRAQATASQRDPAMLVEVRDLQETVAMVRTEITGIEAAIQAEQSHLHALRHGAPGGR